MEINDDTFNIGGIGDLEVSDRPEVVQEEFETIPSQQGKSALKQVYDTYRQNYSVEESLTSTTEFFLEQAANANPAIPNNLPRILAGDYPDWTVTENGETRPPRQEELLQKLTGYKDPTFVELVKQKIPKAAMQTIGTGAALTAGALAAPLLGPAAGTTVALFGIGGALFGADAAEDYLSQEGIIPEVDKVINPKLNALSEGINTFFENVAIGGPTTTFIKKELANKDFSLVKDQVGLNRVKEATNNLFRRGATFLGKGVEDYNAAQLIGLESLISIASAGGAATAEATAPGKPLARLGFEVGFTSFPTLSLPKMAISIYKNKSLAGELGKNQASQVLIDTVEKFGLDPVKLQRAFIEASDPESFRTLPGGEKVPFTPNRNPVEASIPSGVDEAGEPFEPSQAIETLVQNLRRIDQNFNEIYVGASEQEKKELMGYMNKIIATRAAGAVEGAPNPFVLNHNIRVSLLEQDYLKKIDDTVDRVTLANQRIGSQQRLNSDGTFDQTAASEVRRESSIILVDALEDSIAGARRKERSFYDKISKDETVRPTALVEAMIKLREGKLKGLRTKDAKSDRSLDSNDEDLLNQKLFKSEDFAEDPTAAQVAADDFDVDAFAAGQRNKKINIMDVEELRKISDEELLENVQELSFDELMNLRSTFLSKSRSKYADTGDDVLASAYSELARAIDDDITGRVAFELQNQNETGVVTEAGQAIISAWENSKALNDTFTRTFAGRLFQTNKSGARTIPPELALAKLKAGSADAVNLRMSQIRAAARTIGLEVDEAGRPLTEAANQAAAEYRGLAVDDQIGVIYRQLAEKLVRKDGTFDKAGMIKFFDDYGELFKDVPELQELQGALSSGYYANEILQQFSLTVGKTPKQILDMPEKGPEAVGEFVKNIARRDLWAGEIGTDANELFTAIEGSTNPVETLRKAAKWSSEKGGDVAEGFKEAVLDRAFSRLKTRSNSGDLIGNIFTFKETLLGPMGGVRGQPSYLKVLLDEGIIDAEYMVNFKKLVNSLEIQARMDKIPKTPLETALPDPDAVKKSVAGKVKEGFKKGLAAILGSQTLRGFTDFVGIRGGDLIIPSVGAGLGREIAGSGDSVMSIPAFSRKFLLEALEPGNEKVLAGLLERGKEKGFYKTDAKGNYVPRPRGEQAVINSGNRKFLAAVNKMTQFWLPRLVTPVTPKALATERYLEDPQTSTEKLSVKDLDQISDSKRLDDLTPNQRYQRNLEEEIQKYQKIIEENKARFRLDPINPRPPSPAPNRVPLSALPTQPNPASSLAQQGATPQQRSQFANMFPNDITSNIINSRNRGGIGSLV